MKCIITKKSSVFVSVFLIIGILLSSTVYADFRAQYVDQSGGITLKPGETGNLWLDIKNIGTDTWLFGWDTNEVDLALTDSSYTSEVGESVRAQNNWLSPSRPSAPNYAGIGTNSTGRFSFNVTAGEEIGTKRLYMRPVKYDDMFLDNLGAWMDITVQDYTHFTLSANTPSGNAVTLSWPKYTGGSFGSYKVYRFPKTYPALRYYADGSWTKNLLQLPQVYPEYLVATITNVNTLSYQNSLESEKTYVYIVDVCNTSGTTLQRSNKVDVRNVSSYSYSPYERGLKIYYDTTLGDYRNCETFGHGFLESRFRWSTDSAETLWAMENMPNLFADSTTQNLVNFIKDAMPSGVPVQRWSDFKYGSGKGYWYVDPQLKFDTGLYQVKGDLSSPRLSFWESTYERSVLGSLKLGYTYDGIGGVEITNPTTKTVTFTQSTNTAVIELTKDDAKIRAYYKITIHGGVVEIEGSITVLNGSVSNPQLIIKSLSSDGIGTDTYFSSLKTWYGETNKSFLLYDDGVGFVRFEDLCKNNPGRFNGVYTPNGTSNYKYTGTLTQGQVWSDYLAKIRFGSQMLGGTADYYEPTIYNSTQYDNYLFGRLMNYAYTLMGLSYWCNTHTTDSSARATLNQALGVFYNNFTNYTGNAWSSYASISNGSMHYGELGAFLYALDLMADVDSTTTIGGLTYGQMAQNVYNRFPSSATGFFSVDNDQLTLAILGIRKFNGSSDSKASEYETHLQGITSSNNCGYYTTKTYLSYTNKQSANAINALSYFLQLPQWDTNDALVIRNSVGDYSGMGESQAWGTRLYGDLASRYGGVYPLLIGTNNRHTYVPVSLTAINWDSVNKTLNMTYSNSFEELSVYTGTATLNSVKINGATLTAGSDYTFDTITHILRITKTNTLGTNFSVAVKVN